GFVGKDTNGNDKGYFGVEGYYDGDLRGVDGFIEQEVSAGGSPFLLGNSKRVTSLNGSSLELTIDRTLQAMAFEELKKGVEKYSADSGVAILVNSKTGEILFMVNYPTYNPLEYGKYFKEDKDIFINKAISSTYEPGSVIKALTMASALDLGLVTPETTMVDSGPVSYSGHLIDNWDKKHHGEISMTRILELSNNIGAAWVGSKVGSKNLYTYFNKFGFNKKLGVDLEGEESGFIRDYSEWQDIDLATASFGQGISATPLQVVMAFSAIANEGVLMKPYIVKKIINDKEVIDKKPVVLSRVIKPSTADSMVSMLTSAVAQGEAKFFVTKKYNVAGKTGTAQISEKGKYLEDATNATFVGFLPNYRNFVMLVKLERPKASVYASETAVPIWMNILEKTTAYLGLPPDK
ncbi:MAG TPA: penicillin-binding protein 2, partial [candidate division WWE3 bacterium]|nr:penicillin-binding protein 2 [candidate division WWE3 bacterium]